MYTIKVYLLYYLNIFKTIINNCGVNDINNL